MEAGMVERMVALICADSRAAVPVAELAGAIGWTVERVCDVGAEAEEAGWVESWAENPDGPSLSLSALVVERLGLELNRDGSCWCERGTSRPKKSGRRDTPALTETDYLAGDKEGVPLNEQVDPRAPDPAEMVPESIDPPKAPPRGSRTFSGRPRPFHYLGTGMIWSGPALTLPCPGCLGRKLQWYQYCLICDRWGLDHLYPTARPGGARVRYEAGKLKGGLG